MNISYIIANFIKWTIFRSPGINGLINYFKKNYSCRYNFNKNIVIIAIKTIIFILITFFYSLYNFYYLGKNRNNTFKNFLFCNFIRNIFYTRQNIYYIFVIYCVLQHLAQLKIHKQNIKIRKKFYNEYILLYNLRKIFVQTNFYSHLVKPLIGT